MRGENKGLEIHDMTSYLRSKQKNWIQQTKNLGPFSDWYQVNSVALEIETDRFPKLYLYHEE